MKKSTYSPKTIEENKCICNCHSPYTDECDYCQKLHASHQEKCEITNSVHNHKTNGDCGLPCHEAGVRVAPSPHQEGWAEKRMLVVQAVARGWCHKGNERKEMDATLAFAIVEEIMPLLLSLHKADCERFREMIPKENNGESCTEVCEKRRKAGYSCYHATQDEVTNAIRTALSKMEEEV